MTGPTPSIQLMRALDRAGVANCHWKSNEHLDAALNGLTDLDLLVDPGQEALARAVIAEAGFTRFPTSWSRTYPGLEDHLAVDDATGQVHHLHLHFALDAGEPHLKSYRLPWVERTLGTRVVDREHGVHVTAPALETVLLLTRATMKVTLRSRLGRTGLSADERRELDWLLERTDLETVGQVGAELLGPTVVPSLQRLIDQRDHAALLGLRPLVRDALRGDRRYGPLRAPAIGMIRSGAWAAAGVARRRFDRPVRFARHLPGDGLIVAVVGSDGAGKSTLVARLRESLHREIDTMTVYLGSGDGTASAIRRPLVWGRALQSRVRGGSGGPVRVDADGNRIRTVSSMLAVWAVVLTLEKRAKVRRAKTARRRGLLVVVDRWPQAMFLGHGDGPLLAGWSDRRGWRGRVAAWELRTYEALQADGPDLVLRLVVSADVAAKRRPEHDRDDLIRRSEMVLALRFDNARVVDLDADAEAEVVSHDALEAVWASLTSDPPERTT